MSLLFLLKNLSALRTRGFQVDRVSGRIGQFFNKYIMSLFFSIWNNKMHFPSSSIALPTFSQASVLVLGDVMLDRYWSGDTVRVSPEAPVPVVQVHGHEQRPGGAANVALNMRTLGAKVTLVGVIGQDEAGTALHRHLTQEGVMVHFHESPDVATVVKLRVLSRHQQMLRLDFEQPYLDESIERALLDRYKKALPNANLVILSDYQKGALRHPAAFIEAARALNLPVLVDPKSSDVSLYRGATWLTPNLKEFEAMVGGCATVDVLVQKAKELLANYDIANLLITRGEAGMTMVTSQEVCHLEAVSHDIYDVTGAGDTVISTLGAALAAGADVRHAMYLSNIAAGVVVTKLGATAVTLAELEDACANKAVVSTGVMNEADLLQQVRSLQRRGKKIVFTNGCYDIIHAGHLKSLEMAKALGDYLIVAVNTDESIRAIKGDDRPINPLAHRMAVLAGFRAVDWVVPFSDKTPERLLRLIQPDVLAKGGDYTLDQVVGADIARQYGGTVHVLQHDVTVSTTEIIKHIQSLAELGINATVEDA